MIHNQQESCPSKLGSLHGSETSGIQTQSNQSQNKSIGKNSMEHQSCFRGYPVLSMVWVTWQAWFRTKRPYLPEFMHSTAVRTTVQKTRETFQGSQIHYGRNCRHNVSVSNYSFSPPPPPFPLWSINRGNTQIINARGKSRGEGEEGCWKARDKSQKIGWPTIPGYLGLFEF